LALGLAGSVFAQSAAPEFDRREAAVYRAEAGRGMGTAAAGGHGIAVADALRQRGRDGASLAAMTPGHAAPGRNGVTHWRFEQSVGGLPVYGAYAKAAFDRNGQLVQVIDHLATVRSTAALNGAPRAGALQALQAAMALLHPSANARLVASAIDGNRHTFVRDAFFHAAPTVDAVAVPHADGSLSRGWLVQTWTQKGNLLDHTLVSGDGRVLDVERRTANDSYNVFVEDPLKGAQTVVNGPGSGNAESPAGWLGAGAQSTINISGNNVKAYLDADANNAPDSGGTAVTSGNFTTAVDLNASPTTTGNKAVAVQNLFYLNNRIHDILYRHGFNEAAGNFQVNNFGKGGAGNDPVNAEAQDGSGTDNANFATPADGSSPRMQMYLWTGTGPTAFVTVNATTYNAWASSFGAALTTTGINGPLALYNDGSGTTTDACEASTTSLAGKVAIVDRGTCNFTAKVLNAQNAGAIGVLIVNNAPGDGFGPGGTDRKVKIPSAMVRLDDRSALIGAAGLSANLRKNSATFLQLDGDLDADIVFHEYGHGLTWRMIGSMSGALAGAIGEGASDVTAFLVNGDDRIGEYAYSNPAGIRRQPYDTYVGTYKDVTGAEVHNDGEIYAAAMWDLRRNYLADGKTIDVLFADFVDGMNFTPAAPAFEHMRDGMLQSVAGTGRECLIWRAFAARGIGVNAKGTVSRRGAVTITESFALPPTCP
jgi:hypothetical protein